MPQLLIFFSVIGLMEYVHELENQNLHISVAFLLPGAKKR